MSLQILSRMESSFQIYRRSTILENQTLLYNQNTCHLAYEFAKEVWSRLWCVRSLSPTRAYLLTPWLANCAKASYKDPFFVTDMHCLLICFWCHFGRTDPRKGVSGATFYVESDVEAHFAVTLQKTRHNCKQLICFPSVALLFAGFVFECPNILADRD